ncbi:hypothetical protein N2W54_001524 [Lotmaria passim]
MHLGNHGLSVPIPAPTPVPARLAAVPATAPGVVVSPLPLPVPISPPAPPQGAAPPISPSPPPCVPIVPRPVAVPTFFTPPAAPSPPVQPPPPQLLHAVSTFPHSSNVPTAISPSPRATQAIPLPVPSANAPVPWLQTSASSPPPLAPVHAATPLSILCAPSPPLVVSAARPSAAKSVTFSLSAECSEAPATTTPPVPTPLVSALRTPTPAVAAPAVPSLPLPTPTGPAPLAVPTVRLPGPTVPSPSAAPATPSPLPAPTLRTVTPAVATVGQRSMHASVTATPAVAMPAVPALPHASAPVPNLHPSSSAFIPHVSIGAAPTTTTAVSLSVPPLPEPLAPPPLPVPPASHPVALSSLPVQSAAPRTLSPPPLPTLHATDEEAPMTAIEEAELNVPDYSAWLFPVVPHSATALKPALKFPLAEAKMPQLLPAPSLLQWSEADVLASLPLTLPPEYVIFGGARYSGAPLDLLRPPLVPKVPAAKTAAYFESAEAQHLQFLLDQLDVAKNYLKIEAQRMAGARNAAASPPPLPMESVLRAAASSAEDVLVKPGEEENLGKATIWTTAYFGTPQQLYRVLTSRKWDGMLSSAGHVQYRRRQWGLKRAGETFVLGLGMKATALQFAAAAGKLDNVVLLLTNGAKDNASPPLKEILSKDSMAMIASICAPRARPARVSRPAANEVTDVQGTHSGGFSTFLNEQVVNIDDAAYAPTGTTPYPTILHC